MSYGELVDSLKNAMGLDAFMNPDKVECIRVSEQDVSDCPDIDHTVIDFETTEDYMDDLAHEMLMMELDEYAS